MKDQISFGIAVIGLGLMIYGLWDALGTGWGCFALGAVFFLTGLVGGASTDRRRQAR